jgi:hypothetical protein
MSGTVGIVPSRLAGAVSAIRRRRTQVAAQVRQVRSQGGLPVPVAVPLALAITASIAWAVTGIAGMWIQR